MNKHLTQGKKSVKKHLTRGQILEILAAAASAGVTMAFFGACKAAAPKEPTATPGKPATQPTDTQPTQVAPASLKGEVVTLFQKSGSWETAPWLSRQEMFNDVYPNIKLTSIAGLNETALIHKISTMTAAGEPPDLAKVWSQDPILALAPKGVWEDLGPRIDASASMQKTWPQISDEMKKIFRYPVGRGPQFGMPYTLAVGLWYYNKDLFEKMGVTPPSLDWTWEDLVQIGLEMTNKKENQYAYKQGSTVQEMRWFWQAGGTYFSPDGMRVNFDQEPNIQAAEFLADLFVKHQICPPPGVKLGDNDASFDTGQFAFELEGNGKGIRMLRGDDHRWDEFNWSATYAPKGPAAQVDYLRPEALAICRGAKNANLAWTYIDWHMSEEMQTIFSKERQLSVCSDIFKNVSLKSLPDHLWPALERGLTHGRVRELSQASVEVHKIWQAEVDPASLRGRDPGPGGVVHRIWRAEMEPVWLGRLSARQGMMNAFKKAQPEFERILKEIGLMK